MGAAGWHRPRAEASRAPTGCRARAGNSSASRTAGTWRGEPGLALGRHCVGTSRAAWRRGARGARGRRSRARRRARRRREWDSCARRTWLGRLGEVGARTAGVAELAGGAAERRGGWHSLSAPQALADFPGSAEGYSPAAGRPFSRPGGGAWGLAGRQQRGAALVDRGPVLRPVAPLGAKHGDAGAHPTSAARGRAARPGLGPDQHGAGGAVGAVRADSAAGG